MQRPTGMSHLAVARTAVQHIENEIRNPTLILLHTVAGALDVSLGAVLKAGTADIYVTGSNARGFSSELSDRLSGRHMEIPVQPLTYSEFLEFAGAKDSGEVFGRFLRQGGMPGIHSISAADASVFEYLRAVALDLKTEQAPPQNHHRLFQRDERQPPSHRPPLRFRRSPLLFLSFVNWP